MGPNGCMPVPPPPYHHHDGHHHHHHCPGGRVKIIGNIALNVKTVDHHGHTRYFPIVQGEMYYIEALSPTKGKCTFMGRIVDFDSVKGIENILQPPHVIDIGAIIVDYSTDYKADVIRIGVENIIQIKPMETIDKVDSHGKDEFFIHDPFSKHKLDQDTAAAEEDFEQPGFIENF